MFAILNNFAGSDEVTDFFSDSWIADIEFFHDVLVKNGIVIMRLDVIVNRR